MINYIFHFFLVYIEDKKKNEILQIEVFETFEIHRFHERISGSSKRFSLLVKW